MAKHSTSIAHGVLLLGGLALLLWGLEGNWPLAFWFSAPPEIHVFAVAVVGNLLFLAFPFRRRSDMALALAILLAAIDVAGRVPPDLGLSDAAGAALVILPVWTERLRSRGRRERRQRAAWRHAIRVRPGRQEEQHQLLISGD